MKSHYRYFAWFLH